MTRVITTTTDCKQDQSRTKQERTAINKRPFLAFYLLRKATSGRQIEWQIADINTHHKQGHLRPILVTGLKRTEREFKFRSKPRHTVIGLLHMKTNNSIRVFHSDTNKRRQP